MRYTATNEIPRESKLQSWIRNNIRHLPEEISLAQPLLFSIVFHTHTNYQEMRAKLVSVKVYFKVGAEVDKNGANFNFM